MKLLTLFIAILLALNLDAQTTPKNDFSFYLAPYLGFGAFITNDPLVDSYPYMNGEIRMGFKVSKRFYALFSVDTGLNIKNWSYPVLTTITVAPEFFIIEPLSVFAGIGVGILTANTNILSPVITESRAGFEWKLGVNWQIFSWGDKQEYKMPISFVYSGTNTRWVRCHTLLLSTGFMFFN